MERRLAAVLIADVVGYVRLSQADEEGTRARFQADLHDVFAPAIAGHHGRLVKTMGDAYLVEFHSVVDAVRCAVDIQRGKAGRIAATPEAKRLAYRIGINLGDVIVEGDDIHGDGVNIADRLQERADPGGIAISGTAYDQVKAKVEVGYAFLGEQPVKHVAEPVRVYRVLLDPKESGKTIAVRKSRERSWRRSAVAAAAIVALVGGGLAWQRPWEPEIEAAAVERMALPLPDKPSIVVLPFSNMSGDPEQEYFADGMTEDLTTDLSRLSGLFVISRNTAFTYKGKAVKPAQVAEELGVRYILEGSVRRAGDEVRINAQLIDAISGGHLWADRYDGSTADIFALQDKVTDAIVDALALRLANAEQLTVSRRQTSIPAAHDAYLRGLEHFRHTTADDYAKAVPYFEEAIRLDPDYGRAYGALATLYLRGYARDYAVRWGLSNRDVYDKAKHYLLEAQKRPTSVSHQAAGYDHALSGNYKQATAELQEAITLDPGDSWSYVFMGWALSSAGRAAEGVPHIQTGMRLDPHYPPTFLWFLGHAQFGAEDYASAAESLERMTELSPDDDAAFVLLVATYGHLGRQEDGRSTIARANDVRVKGGGVPLTVFDSPTFYFSKSGDRNRVKKGLRLAGVPESFAMSEFADENRLTADEIRSLVFGHRLHGHSLWSGEERAASITKDGVVDLTGDWGLLGRSPSTGGMIEIDREYLCYRFGTANYCGYVLRNPGGTKAKENEFIWYNNEAFTFSQVE